MSDALPPTVHSLHVLAEHVLGAGLYASTGHIGLQATPEGFATPDSAVGALGGRFAVSSGALERTAPDGVTEAAPVTTVRAAAEFFGVAPGMPPTVYTPATELDLDARLPVETEVAERVGAWFGTGDAALARLASRHPELGPGGRTIWPEHFDLGLSMGEVNYGISPGDASIPIPYAYVGPWEPRTGPFWDRPFGTARTIEQVPTVEDLMAFFEEGRSQAAGSA